MKKYITSLFLIALFSCSPSEEELQKKKEIINQEIEQIYKEAKSIPSSEPCKNFEAYKKLNSFEVENKTSIYIEISQIKIKEYEKKCDDELKRIEAERERLEEMNKTGDWEYGNYVDEFGDKTNKGFLSLTTLGTFSNSATENSPLRVKMFISDGSLEKNNPWFRLYEYNGRNPIKGVFSSNPRKCRIKKEDGETYMLYLLQSQGADHMEINDHRLYKDEISSLKYSIRNGESLKFSCIDNSEYSSCSYRFNLDFQYFENILRKYRDK